MTVFALKGVVPTLGSGAFVAPTASVIGDVVLGDESSVWFGTVLRGDVFPIRVGARIGRPSRKQRVIVAAPAFTRAVIQAVRVAETMSTEVELVLA